MSLQSMQTRLIRLLALALIWGGAVGIAKGQAEAAPLEIVGLGDSLMAGFELPEGDGFPAVLESALKARGINVNVINAGVSGDTTSGGLERLDWSVPEGTRLVILELGANDALRGISPEITKDNLDRMLGRLKERNIQVVLAGMLAPPSMGKEYEAAFNPLFSGLAAKYGVPLIPFFLEGVAGNPSLQLPDGLHPTRAGVDKMVENALPVILPVVEGLVKLQ